jgi:hypothetical protein
MHSVDGGGGHTGNGRRKKETGSRVFRAKRQVLYMKLNIYVVYLAYDLEILFSMWKVSGRNSIR